MQDIVTQLNQSQNEVTYTLNGNFITGAWNLQGQAAGWSGKSEVDFTYKIVVEVHPNDHSFSFIENMESDRQVKGLGEADAAPSVPFQEYLPKREPGAVKVYNRKINTFKGKTFGWRSMGFEHRFGGQPGSDTISYNFSADRIKVPLLRALENAGYRERKGSFWKKLFGKSTTTS